MPPKTKFKPENIITISFNHVRQYGWESLSARHIAKKMGSTTRPIYSHFSSMSDLKNAVMKRVLDLYHDYQSTHRSDDIFLDMGLGVISFAKAEPELFKFMYDPENMEIKKKYDEIFFNKALDRLTDHPRLKNFSKEIRKEFMFTMYAFTLGITTLIDSGWLSNWDDTEIASVLHRTGLIHYRGYIEELKQTGQGAGTVSKDGASGNGQNKSNTT